MIDRGVTDLDYDFDRFDWFNDGKDTARWLACASKHPRAGVVLRQLHAIAPPGWGSGGVEKPGPSPATVHGTQLDLLAEALT